jgi:DUF971 family protein
MGQDALTLLSQNHSCLQSYHFYATKKSGFSFSNLLKPKADQRGNANLPIRRQLMGALPHDVTPTSYELDEEHHQLWLSWSDEHESRFDYERFRRACPCAWCAGEGGLPGNLDQYTALTEEQTLLYELQMVGRYGLTPVWGDGHKTGIYTYEKLRAMCECDTCQTERNILHHHEA